MDIKLVEKLRKIFAQETQDQLVELEKLVFQFSEKVDSTEISQESLDGIFRIIHTIKANSGTVGFNNLMEFLHHIESVLDQLRNGELQVNKEFASLLIDIVGVIGQDVNHCIASESDIDKDKNRDIEKKFNSFQKHKTKEDTKHEKHYYQIIWRPSTELLKMANDPLIFLRELEEQGKVVSSVCSKSRLPDFDKYVYDELYLSWEIVVNTDKSLQEIQNIFIFVKSEGEILIEDVTSSFTFEGAKKSYADKRIGEILVEQGKVDEKAVLAAEITKEKLGDILVQEKKISQKDLEKALKDQELARKNIPTTVRVDIAKLDSLVNLIGELVIAESKIQTIANTINKIETRRSILTACDELTRLIGSLQDRIMTTRMVSVDTLFSQFHRTVRDLSVQQGKMVRLVLTGQETELDKNIIEKISSPIKHLVRNAIDHGIETPSERKALNKPEEAMVQLKAYQKEGSIYLEVTDDGKGLNKDKIIKKAKERNLITEEEILDDDEIYNLIFMPGFSTVEVVTDISGRGVGMDVVKKAVDELKGKVSIKTSKDKGTSFIIKLPLTLAIVEGLTVKIGNEIYIIPLLAVNQTFRPKKNEVKTIESKGEYIEFNNSAAPLIRLHKLFNIKGAIEDPMQALLLNISSGFKNYSLMVDEIIGQQQIVIKNLEQNLGKVSGFSGATILGDGNVAAILEPKEIFDLYKKNKSVGV